MTDTIYPPEAFDRGGTLWWEVKNIGGRVHGDERRMAAWLAFNAVVGSTFTMKDLREALGVDDQPNVAEHLNRRLRRLRQDGWVIYANKDDRSLAPGIYRLERIGWHPGLGKRPKSGSISQGLRRRVFERDGRRCVVCGIGSNEPYSDTDPSRAVLTIGHRTARDQRGSSTDINNLQTECKRCNEPVRHELGTPETIEQIWVEVRRLRTPELSALLSWVRENRRQRSRLDEVYDRVRKLSLSEREEFAKSLADMLGE